MSLKVEADQKVNGGIAKIQGMTVWLELEPPLPKFLVANAIQYWLGKQQSVRIVPFESLNIDLSDAEVNYLKHTYAKRLKAQNHGSKPSRD